MFPAQVRRPAWEHAYLGLYLEQDWGVWKYKVGLYHEAWLRAAVSAVTGQLLRKHALSASKTRR